ncbi:MAG: hypothetical protein ACRCWF_00115 [Beijerinckiaceae bacterium]
MKKTDGLQRMLDFIDFLNKQKIKFSVHNRSHDSISIDFAGVGIRYEVDFFVDHMCFSYFKGDEDVFRGDANLKKLIKEHWGD